MRVVRVSFRTYQNEGVRVSFRTYQNEGSDGVL